MRIPHSQWVLGITMPSTFITLESSAIGTGPPVIQKKSKDSMGKFTRATNIRLGMVELVDTVIVLRS